MRNFIRVVLALIWGLNIYGMYLLTIYTDMETRVLIGVAMGVNSLIFLCGSIATTVGEKEDVDFKNI